MREQVGSHCARLRGDEARLDERDAALVQPREEFAQLRDALALADTRPRAVVIAAGFEREIDHAIARVFASKVANLAGGKQCLSDWIITCGIQAADFAIEAPEQAP